MQGSGQFMLWRGPLAWCVDCFLLCRVRPLSFACRWMEGGSVGTGFPVFFQQNNNPTERLSHYHDLRFPPSGSYLHGWSPQIWLSSQSFKEMGIINAMVAVLNIGVL